MTALLPFQQPSTTRSGRSNPICPCWTMLDKEKGGQAQLPCVFNSSFNKRAPVRDAPTECFLLSVEGGTAVALHLSILFSPPPTLSKLLDFFVERSPAIPCPALPYLAAHVSSSFPIAMLVIKPGWGFHWGCRRARSGRKRLGGLRGPGLMGSTVSC